MGGGGGKNIDMIEKLYIRYCNCSTSKNLNPNMYGTGRIGQRSEHFKKENSNVEVPA